MLIDLDYSKVEQPIISEQIEQNSPNKPSEVVIISEEEHTNLVKLVTRQSLSEICEERSIRMTCCNFGAGCLSAGMTISPQVAQN